VVMAPVFKRHSAETNTLKDSYDLFDVSAENNTFPCR
jgi:hypothetical protein